MAINHVYQFIQELESIQDLIKTESQENVTKYIDLLKQSWQLQINSTNKFTEAISEIFKK